MRVANNENIADNKWESRWKVSTLPECYSIRMRAAEGGAHELGGKHISGGERLGNKSQLEKITAELLAKACNHSRGNADFIQLIIEQVQVNNYN